MLSIAPMLDWTDRHYRYLMRLMSRRVLLYTEMVNMNAILRGDPERHLAFSEQEHPVALQVAGDDPAKLAQAAAIAREWGYDEVNLNVGCPSERVQNGNFGACLMASPNVVARSMAAMKRAVDIPVTVKHRIGIDELDSYEHMRSFVEEVSEAGVTRFIVHARKAWLQGLSPKENRDIPPLRYEYVYRLKEELPHLEIHINGGVKSFAEVERHLEHVDGVMVGRWAYHDPYDFACADARIFGEEAPAPSRLEVVEGYRDYVASQQAAGARLNTLVKPLLNLMNGRPGARAWRRTLSEGVVKASDGAQLLDAALEAVPDSVLTERPEPHARAAA